jgi:phenol 2-monooxygenase
VIDVLAVFQQAHRDLDPGTLPPLLLPRKGRFGLIDYEKAFRPDPAADVFALRGVDRATGCLVVVRPDQYVAHVLPLDGDAALAELLAGVLLTPAPSPAGRARAAAGR